MTKKLTKIQLGDILSFLSDSDNEIYNEGDATGLFLEGVGTFNDVDSYLDFEDGLPKSFVVSELTLLDGSKTHVAWWYYGDSWGGDSEVDGVNEVEQREVTETKWVKV